MAATAVAGYDLIDHRPRVDDLFGSGEDPLRPDDHGRIVLTTVGAADVMEPRRGDRNDLVLRVHPGMDREDRETVRIAQQRVEQKVFFRQVDSDGPVAVDVVHIENRDGKTGKHLFFDKQPRVVHGVGENHRQREAVGSRSALVGGDQHEGLDLPLGRSEGAVDFSDAGSGALDVAAWRVHQEVLTGGIVAAVLCHPGHVHERTEGPLVDLVVVDPVLVDHQKAGVVAGVADVAVDDESFVGCVLHSLPRDVEHVRAGLHMPAGRTDVCFDGGDGVGCCQMTSPILSLGFPDPKVLPSDRENPIIPTLLKNPSRISKKYNLS